MEVKPAYQQTDVGLIPTDWEVCCLENLTVKSHPITYGVLKPGDYVPNGIPLLQIQDVIHGDIKMEDLHRIGKQLDGQYSRTRLSEGDLVVSLIGTVGRVASIPPALAGANLHRNLARVHISPGISKGFVLHYLRSEKAKQLIELATFGSTQALLNLSDLRRLLIARPSFAEQEAIAEALSDADVLIESLEELLTKKRHLKQGAMQELLTGKNRLPGFEIKPGYKQTEVGIIPEDWSIRPLGEVVTFLDGKRRPVKDTDRAKMRGSIPYYGASGVVDYVNDYLFDEDLILLGEDGENILSRNCRLAFRISGKAWVNNHAHVLKPNLEVNIGFLSDYLESLNYEQYNSGTAQPKLNKQTCLGIPVTSPPTKAEQEAIAVILSDMDAEIAALGTKLTKTRHLKQGMMQELLTGRIRLVDSGKLRDES